MYSKALKEKTNKYSNAYSEYGYSPLSLFMPSDRRNIRYSELLKNFNLKKNQFFSLLDAGCGFGDINMFLTQIGIENYSYLGMDVVSAFIEEGMRLYGNSSIIFENKDFLTEDIGENTYDFVISSQTFNERMHGDKTNNYDILEASIEKLFLISKVGFSFNFFTDKVNFLKEDTAYHDPAKVLTFAYSLSKNVILDNSCMPYECTITIYKDDACSKQGMIFRQFEEWNMNMFDENIFVIRNK